MIELFLRAKHWQIFMITFGLPLLIQLFVVFTTITEDDPMIMTKRMMNISPIMIFSLCGFFGWLWSAGIGLQNKIPSDIKLRIRKFKIFLIIPLIYILLFSTYIYLKSIANGQEVNASKIVEIILPLHLFSMFCIFYCFYFVAKTFKTVELQRKVTYSDFAIEFFMIWFFPIGIWGIQPKINKTIEE